MIYRYLHICFCFVFITELSYSQYSIIPTNTTGLIKSIEKSGDYLLICGKENYLAKYRISTDELIPLTTTLGSEYFQYHIQMLDSNTFYTTGFIASPPYRARIIRTTDGGQTWDDVLDTISDLFYVNRLLVFDTNRIALLSTASKSFVTSDGGQTWEFRTGNLPPISSTSLRVNDSCAIIGRLGGISITVDKADSWQGQSSTGEARSFSAKTLDSIYYVASDHAGNYFAYYFRQSNTKVIKGLGFEPKGIYAFSKDEIYVIGGGGRIAKTTDLGTTWSYFHIPEATYLYDINFINDSIALIGGDNGLLIKWNKNSHFSSLSIAENNPFLSSISIFPNPSNTTQTIQFHNQTDSHAVIHLVDLAGERIDCVFEGVLSEIDYSIETDLSNLKSGVYFYQIQIGSEIGYKRFVKT